MTNRNSAIIKAEERYILYRSKIQQNEKIFSITANELRDRFLEHIETRVSSRMLSRGRANIIKTFTNHYIAFIGKTTKIQNYAGKNFKDYFTFRRQTKPDMLATVIRNETTTIKQMYKFASDEGLINQNYKLDFGIIKVNKSESTRESFTPEEYNQLINYSKNWYKDKGIETDEERYYRRLIHDFILIMANGGFRTGELRHLKWKDVKKITQSESETYAEIIIRAENTKVRKSRTFEMRRGDVFERIKTYSKFTEREDFVFSFYNKNDLLNQQLLYSYFNKLKSEVGKKYPSFDTEKDLYCLRHFWITIRILAGLNVYDIAKISGTSLSQIQTHYDAANSLVTSQKMNLNKLRINKHGNVIVD